jgi:TPP-dependent indolepyruvate ferredoxin oxidoreductase alpha subunit
MVMTPLSDEFERDLDNVVVSPYNHYDGSVVVVEQSFNDSKNPLDSSRNMHLYKSDSVVSIGTHGKKKSYLKKSFSKLNMQPNYLNIIDQ